MGRVSEEKIADDVDDLRELFELDVSFSADELSTHSFCFTMSTGISVSELDGVRLALGDDSADA